MSPLAVERILNRFFFWVVGAQNFEYKISSILDKPTESLFGYISVLVSVQYSLLPILGILTCLSSLEHSLRICTSIYRELSRRLVDHVSFRYIALQNDKQGQGPLASYFKGEVLHGRDTDIFTSNMCTSFLAFLLARHSR